jgi:cysteine desulfurase
LYISAGSACSSGKVKRSALLAAMGLEHEAAWAVRVSAGHATTAEHWQQAADILLSSN